MYTAPALTSALFYQQSLYFYLAVRYFAHAEEFVSRRNDAHKLVFLRGFEIEPLKAQLAADEADMQKKSEEAQARIDQLKSDIATSQAYQAQNEKLREEFEAQLEARIKELEEEQKKKNSSSRVRLSEVKRNLSSSVVRITLII